jgi:hypothetical protein
MTGGTVVSSWADRPQLRRGHERRHRLCARRAQLFDTLCNLDMVDLESRLE